MSPGLPQRAQIPSLPLLEHAIPTPQEGVSAIWVQQT